MEQFGRLARVYLKPHRQILMLVLLAALLSSLAPFTFSYLSKVMVDDVLQVGHASVGEQSQMRGETSPAQVRNREEVMRRDGPVPVSNKAHAVRLLVWIFVAYIGLRLFLAVVQWGYSYGIARIGQEVVFRIRQDVYDKLQTLQVSYFDRLQTGKIMSRVMDDVNAAVYGVIGDSVNGVRVMMSFARELRELRRFFGGLSEYFRFQVRNSMLNTSLSVLCGLVSGVGTTLVIYFGILAIRDGQMTLGSFLYFYGLNCTTL